VGDRHGCRRRHDEVLGGAAAPVTRFVSEIGAIGVASRRVVEIGKYLFDGGLGVAIEGALRRRCFARQGREKERRCGRRCRLVGVVDQVSFVLRRVGLFGSASERSVEFVVDRFDASRGSETVRSTSALIVVVVAGVVIVTAGG